jgi:hypothetical protein
VSAKTAQEEVAWIKFQNARDAAKRKISTKYTSSAAQEKIINLILGNPQEFIQLFGTFFDYLEHVHEKRYDKVD